MATAVVTGCSRVRALSASSAPVGFCAGGIANCAEAFEEMTVAVCRVENMLESKGALWKVAVASDLGFGIRRHRLAPTSVLVWDVVLVVASPVWLREVTMLERLPHKMIFVVCPRARD